jgi:hypothetical protein
VQLHDKDAFGVSGQIQIAIGVEIVLHDVSLAR